MQAFTHVRHSPIQSIDYLNAQQRHALRLDKTSEVRDGATPGAALLWRNAIDGATFDPRAYAKNYRARVTRSKAALRKGSALGSHFLIGVSPAWIEEAGDLHDEDNPRNRALLAESIAWVESWAGEGAVFSARLDLDEAGGGVADIFAAPIRRLRDKHGGSRPYVSIRQAQKELQESTEESSTYRALQTSWHAWATARLDPTLLRGEPAGETGRKHLPVQAFKKERDALRAEALAISSRKESVGRREGSIAALQALLVEHEREVVQGELDNQARDQLLALRAAELNSAEVEIKEREAALKHHEMKLLHQQSALAALQNDLDRQANAVEQATFALRAAIKVLKDPLRLSVVREAAINPSWSSEADQSTLTEDTYLRACRPLWPLMAALIKAADDNQRSAEFKSGPGM